LECRIGYSTELFDRATAERIGAVLSRLVEQVSEDPERRIGDVEVVSAHERQLVLSVWNRTEQPMPEVMVADLFEEQVRLRPDAVAVRCESETMTYQELERAANRLAHHLIEHGAGPERVVALSLPRGCDLVVAMLAVWKVGAAYLPLSSDLPPARVAQLVAEADPVMVLDRPPASAQYPTGPPPRRGSGQHPAYVIYTSGSTGRPKGVVVTHGGIQNQLLWLRDSYPLAPDQVMFARTPIGFDPSGLEIWLPLVCGATLCLATDEIAADVRRFLDYAHRNGATHAHFVPSLLAEVVPVLAEQGRFLQRIFVGGEPLSADLARRAGGVVNLYGPTEATIQAVCWSGPDAEVRGAAAPIGRPVGNMRAYVLDSHLRPAPVGVTGELYLAGAQLARGYLNQPARTAERFVANPFGPAGERMYRTGDLARWRDDAMLEFAGRADAQLKIRGHRIEPGEVEAAVTAHDEVAQSAVIAREDRQGDPRLVAYVAPADVDLERLRRHLTAVLPRYLVPDDLVALERLPLTANEKLDRAALPAPERTGFGFGFGFVEPHTPGEELLAEIFAEVLGVERVGVDDDFFALGGHSLLAVRLASRIRSVLGVELTLQRLLQARSVSGLLDLVHGGGVGSDPFATLLPLRRGPGTPVFCVHPIVGLGWCYTGLARWLPPHTPLYGLQARGAGGGGRLPERIDDMAQDYVEQVQRVQPAGPYQLLGWSFGGTVAHAMATQLQQRGERVSLLALVDSYPHRPEPGGPASTTWVTDLTHQHLSQGALRAIDADRLPDIERVCANNLRLADRHVPRTFNGDVVFFAARHRRRPPHVTPDRWREHVTGQVVVHQVEAGHYELMHPGPLAQIASVLGKAISAAGSVVQEEHYVEPVR
jgi:amino acid adenylation domain-containing protein